MKKSILKLVAVFMIFAMLSLPVYSNLYAAETDEITVSVTPNAEKVLEARFLNMLNHNFVYNESYDDINDIVNDSIFALLDKRDIENDSYISESYVNGYLLDMFGFEIDDFSNINAEFPQKSGYVYILPRGLVKYEHSNISVEQNEDGTYTAISDVKIVTHDGLTEEKQCKTMFAKNSESVFGFNIVKSEIFDLKQFI